MTQTPDRDDPRGEEWVASFRGHKHFDKLREKVLQWLRDFWRPYHGGLGPRDDRPGGADADVDPLMMVAARNFGGEGHYPLNGAIEASWKDTRLNRSRELFGHMLYGLAMWHPAVFGELQDFFASYGAGDSDREELVEKAERYGPESRSAERLEAIDFGIDWIVASLIAAGVTNRDFWADFVKGDPPPKVSAKEERYRRYYLAFVEECRELQLERPGKPYRHQAAKAVARREGVSERTVREAVAMLESGYIREEFV